MQHIASNHVSLQIKHCLVWWPCAWIQARPHSTQTQTCSQPPSPFAPGVGQAGALTTLYCVTPDSACLPGPAASSSTRPAASASRRTTRLSSGCSPQSRQPGRWRLSQGQSVLAGEINEAHFTVDAQKSHTRHGNWGNCSDGAAPRWFDCQTTSRCRCLEILTRCHPRRDGDASHVMRFDPGTSRSSGLFMAKITKVA